DMAFRAGTPGTLGGKVRRIADLAMCLVASPEYLAQNDEPKTPDDLEALAYVQYFEDPDERTITLQQGRSRIDAPVKPAFAAQVSHLIMHAARNHLGFVKVARAIAADDLAAGRLVELLPATPPIDKPLYLVTNTAFRATRRSEVFLAEVSAAVAKARGLTLA
ncbi:MAG: LysR substrate-binding domain-containing protein, partial [Deltaproteobacteria bacterium]